jgi:hypothetical protein
VNRGRGRGRGEAGREPHEAKNHSGHIHVIRTLQENQAWLETTHQASTKKGNALPSLPPAPDRDRAKQTRGLGTEVDIQEREKLRLQRRKGEKKQRALSDTEKAASSP